MIYLYSGTPGSGKSLHAASRILSMCRKKKRVIANFEINLDVLGKYADWFLYLPNELMTPQSLIHISDDEFYGRRILEGGLLLVLDECQLILNSREWQKNSAKGWVSFFTQHRKYGYDVILISQFDRMIDRQVRSLIEYEYQHRKISNIGGFWGFVLPIFMGRFHVMESWYPVKMKVGGGRVWYGRKTFELYDTHKAWT